MPNVISRDKRSVTFLESRRVIGWMEELARARNTDLSVILREATSSYYAQHQTASTKASLTELRAASKAARRIATARQITSGNLKPLTVQKRHAPINRSVRIVDLWSSIRRHVHAAGT